MTTPRRFLSAAVLAGMIGAFTAACSSHADTGRPEARVPVPVKVATVGMTDIGGTFETGGVVEARTTATLTARIVAPVQTVRVVPGDRVRAGQVLIVLDGRDLVAQARSARAASAGAAQGATAAAAEARAAQAALTLARATHTRIASLHDNRSATSQELDQAIAQLRMADERAAGATARAEEAASSVERAQGASEAASTTESFAQITAPFDGVVVEKLVEPGNMAAPGMPLLRMEDTREFRLDVRVDASRIDAITPGAAVPVTLEGGSDGTITTVNGVVSEIARAVETDTRAFSVKISLPGATGIRSGMFGRARLGATSRRALTVPAEAVVRRGQVTFVFVEDKGVARLRLVNLADAEVLAGLAEGERVIVDPSAEIADGRPVTEGGR